MTIVRPMTAIDHLKQNRCSGRIYCRKRGAPVIKRLYRVTYRFADYQPVFCDLCMIGGIPRYQGWRRNVIGIEEIK